MYFDNFFIPLKTFNFSENESGLTWINIFFQHEKEYNFIDNFLSTKKDSCVHIKSENGLLDNNIIIHNHFLPFGKKQITIKGEIVNG